MAPVCGSGPDRDGVPGWPVRGDDLKASLLHDELPRTHRAVGAVFVWTEALGGVQGESEVLCSEGSVGGI